MPKPNFAVGEIVRGRGTYKGEFLEIIGIEEDFYPFWPKKACKYAVWCKKDDSTAYLWGFDLEKIKE